MTHIDRRSVAPQTVLWFLALSLVVSFAFGYFVYVRYIRYVPKAASYLPRGAALTAFIDVEQGVVYEPFRRHFFPLLELGRVEREPRILHFERKTTIELGVDTREFAFALGPGPDFTLAIGGMFRRDGVVVGAAEMVREEGGAATVAPDESYAQLGSWAFFSSTEDGVLLLTRDEPRPLEHSRRGPSVASKALVLCWMTEGREHPCLDVETRADFPYRLREAESAPWPTGIDPLLASGALRPLAEAADGPPTVRREGQLGREGFDALLASLAETLARSAHSGFDPRPRKR